jgi:hypothetical protein
LTLTPEQIAQFMETSRTAEEWDKNCDLVKEACGGYPSFWWETIMVSGLARRTMAKFGETPDLKIVKPEPDVHPHNW